MILHIPSYSYGIQYQVPYDTVLLYRSGTRYASKRTCDDSFEYSESESQTRYRWYLVTLQY
jgi:hypothetical protein